MLPRAFAKQASCVQQKEDQQIGFARLEELEEAAIIVKAMWSSRPATFEGQHYRIRDAYCEPQPDPPIPLLIGGNTSLSSNVQARSLLLGLLAKSSRGWTGSR
jgi:alkanesulfonate monooxygenase SsuD/methylene tetrahydromethanopterin reductase-like flavin-dependent oxidoreductase (luciferase family)